MKDNDFQGISFGWTHPLNIVASNKTVPSLNIGNSISVPFLIPLTPAKENDNSPEFPLTIRFLLHALGIDPQASCSYNNPKQNNIAKLSLKSRLWRDCAMLDTG